MTAEKFNAAASAPSARLSRRLPLPPRTPWFPCHPGSANGSLVKPSSPAPCTRPTWPWSWCPAISSRSPFCAA